MATKVGPKEGKRHAYWALVESYRTARGPWAGAYAKWSSDRVYLHPARYPQSAASSMSPSISRRCHALRWLRRSASAEFRVYCNRPLNSIGALSAFSHRFRACGLLSASLLKRGVVAVRPRHPVLRPLRLVRHRRLLQILGHLPVRLARWRE